jgi:hypothetical protein
MFHFGAFYAPSHLLTQHEMHFGKLKIKFVKLGGSQGSQFLSIAAVKV